jgi:hypothetical protein
VFIQGYSRQSFLFHDLPRLVCAHAYVLNLLICLFSAEYTGEIVGDAECEARETYYERHGIADYMFRLGPNEVIDASVRACRARYINHSCDPNCFTVITLPQKEEPSGRSSTVADALLPCSDSSCPRGTGADIETSDNIINRDISMAQDSTLPVPTQARVGIASDDDASDSDSQAFASTKVTLANKPTPPTLSGRRVFIYALRPIRAGEELCYDYSFSADEKAVICRCGAASCRGTLNVL